MFQMVEELEIDASDGGRKLLFLTNPQAELIASSRGSLQKMLDALELPKPKLVINFLMSLGFRQHVTAFPGLLGGIGGDAGICDSRPAFQNAEDEHATMRRIDRFMSETLIPLAAQTSAIVLCSATLSDCVLSASFTRMYAVHRAKWSGKPPFSIISVSKEVRDCYDARCARSPASFAPHMHRCPIFTATPTRRRRGARFV